MPGKEIVTKLKQRNHLVEQLSKPSTTNEESNSEDEDDDDDNS